MNKPGFVALIGVLLIFLNIVFNNQGSLIMGVVWDGKSLDKSLHVMADLGGEAALLFVLLLLANSGDAGANVSLAFISALFLVWAVNNTSKITSYFNKGRVS